MSSNPSIPPKSDRLSSDNLIIIVVTSIFALGAVIVILLVIRRLRHAKGGTPVYDAEKFAAWRDEKFTPRCADEDPPRLQRLRSTSCPQQPSLSRKLSLFVLRKPPLPPSTDDVESDAQSSIRAPSVSTDISRFRSTTLVVHHVPKDQEATLTISRDILLGELRDLILKSFEDEDCSDQQIELHRVADRVEGVSLLSTGDQLASFLEAFKYSTTTHIYLYYPRPPPPAIEEIPPPAPAAVQPSDEVDLTEATVTKESAHKHIPTPLKIDAPRSRCISGPCGSWVEVNSVAPSAGVRSQTSPGEGRWW